MTLIKRFKEIVRYNEGRVAVKDSSQAITFKQLDVWSDSIAEAILERVTYSDDRCFIGIYGQRSVALVAMYLGVWKAGFAYLPLDPAHTAARQKNIINDCVPALILTDMVCLPPIIEGFNCLNISNVCKTGTGKEVRTPAPPCKYAYMIYTSGTTGQPKGVPILQESLENLIEARQEFIPSAENTMELCYASISFDASVWETFPALLTGTALYVANEEERHNPQLLLDVLEKEQVSVATIPPVMLSMMPYKPLTGLKYLVVAGEKCGEATIKKWQQTCQVINAYGPTETTVCATACLLDANSHPNDIGTPLRNTLCFILDERQKPVAKGEKGELYVGGIQLTEGYWHDEKLNAEKFFVLPDVANGSRLYATGDIAYYDEQGHIVFCGRKDFQIKIHGFRVELGEVQSAIEQNPHVSAAAIEAVEQGSMRAYVVTDGSGFNMDQLRAYLTEILPPYMIPTTLFEVADIPYNINGKTDFTQLRQLYQQYSSECHEDNPECATAGQDTQLQDDIERRIALIWSAVLEKQAPNDNTVHFYEYGGDSVTTILMNQMLEKEFSITLSISEVFKDLHLNTIAQLVREAIPAKHQRIIRTGVRNRVPIPTHLHDLFMHSCLSEETSKAYNLAIIIPFDNDLNLDLLYRAWNLMRLTHDALRFKFVLNAVGQPELYLMPYDSEPSIPVVEAKEDELWADANERLATLIQYDHLYTPVLYHKPDGDYLFVLFIHHLISDGWTAGIIKQQLKKIYNTLTGNHQFYLPHLTYNYIDYAIDKTEHEAEQKQRHSSYWKGYLNDVADLQLPYRQSATIGSSDYAACYEQETLPAEASQKLQSLCGKYHVTLFTLLSAAYMSVLSRYCRQDNFVVGYPSAGRTSNLYSDIIGYFVHTLPLRYRSEYKNQSALSFCKQVKADVMEGENHLLPLSQIISAMDQPSGMVDCPLIQTILSVEDAGFENQHLYNKYAHFPLTLLVVKEAKGLKCQWMYRQALFTADSIKTLSHCLVNMLTRIADNPEKPLGKLAMTSDNDIAEVKTANTVFPLVTPKETIIDLFKEQVGNSSHPWIIKDSNSQLSFNEFDQQSDSVAECLLRRVHNHAATGLFMNRSVKAIVAMMGILKAGNMYVPLDKSYPAERLKTMIADSQMSSIVCNRELADDVRQLNLPPSINVLIYDDCIDQQLPLTSQPQPIDSQTPAYMIYTSGTTGKPKGVVVTHGNVVSFVKNGLKGRFQPTAHDVVLQYCSYLFDVSINDIFASILQGAQLICIDEEERRDPDRLFAILEKEKVTQAYIAPAFLLACNRDVPETLKTLIVGGESPSQTLVDRYVQHVTMINGYGPTENTVFSTSHNYTTSLLHDANCIGKGLPGVTCYVLDDFGHPVPKGCPGELYLGGLQVSPGYYNRPEINAERFISNPFVTEDDEQLGQNTRIYATGDIVRQDAEGNIFYLGRKDFQVKIRGFRVELHEIETVLARHPEVDQCIVQVQGQDVSTVLVAYVISPNPSLTSKQLRAYLTQYLPAYMVPDDWFIAQQLPLNASGKIDRRNLPKATTEAEGSSVTDGLPDGGDTQTEEFTEEETKTITLVARVADIPAANIGLDDDLYSEHGLNSLHVLELAHQLSNRGYNIHPTDFYRQNTIRKLSAFLESDECKKGLTDKQIDDRICYFATPDDLNKPIIVVASGYPHYEWFYGNFHRLFEKDYTIVVIETPNELYDLRRDLEPSADAMIEEYIRLLRPIAERRPIAGITGLCFGGDIALKVAVRLNQYHLSKPVVFDVDGYACRSEYEEWSYLEQEGVSDEVNDRRNEVMAKLSKSFVQEYYPGTVYLFRATIFADEPGQSKERGEELFPINCANWAKSQPDLKVVLMDFVHMDLVVKTESVMRIKHYVDLELLKKES